MDAITVTFLALGGLAILLLLLSLVGGHAHLGHLHLGHLHLGHLHLGHLHIGHLHFGHPHVGPAGNAGAGPGAGVELTLPAIAGFLGAFGFAGAVAATLVNGHGAGTALLAVVVGLVVGLPAAWLADRLMTAAVNMNTDATLTSNDLVGTSGIVITPVPTSGYGEVRLAIAGQQMKFNARADQPLALGTRVFVIEVPTPTSVLVEPTPGSE